MRMQDYCLSLPELLLADWLIPPLLISRICRNAGERELRPIPVNYSVFS